MIQLYLLSIIYMLISSMILLIDYYREKLLFLLRFRALLEENKKALNIYFLSGLVIGVLMFFLPIAPGPMFLGDLIPASWVVFLAIYFRVIYSDRNKEKSRFYFDGSGKGRSKLGKISILILFIHFLLPSFVLL